jgi:proteasome lid subunit RPN8/RPN11
MPPEIRFTALAWDELKRLSEAAYPFEGCGLLLGPYGSDKIAQKVIALKNMLREQGRGRFDFTFSPAEFAQAQLAADRENLDVVGIFHTHPDHPPRPSATDAGQPMLAGWVNVIAGVHGGRFKVAKAWWREDEVQPFVETALHVDESK